MNAMAVNQEYKRNKIHPQKFATWLACASITMMFTALTSAYIVRQAGGNWLEFRLPDIFLASTMTIVASSIALHGSFLAYKKGKEQLYKMLLLLGLALGFAFVITQYQGWVALQNIGVPLKTNPSGDFVYAISGLHAAHVLGGIVALIIGAIRAFSTPFKVTERRKLRQEMTLTYWHFVDLLWVYLFALLTLYS